MTPVEILKAAEKDFHVPTGNVTTREFVEWVEKKSLVARPQKDLTLAILRAELERVEGKINTKEHICRFNDGESNCDCYNQALADHANYIKSQIKLIEEI